MNRNTKHDSFFSRQPDLTVYFDVICTTLREYKKADIKSALESYLKTYNQGFPSSVLKVEVFYKGKAYPRNGRWYIYIPSKLNPNSKARHVGCSDT